MQAVVEFHLPGRCVMVLDQGTGVVEQQLTRQPTKIAERALNPLQPCRLPFVAERRRIDPSRIAERGHEQIDSARRLVVDRDPTLAEVDLQLTTRWGLKPHRRQRLCRQHAAQMRYRAFDSAQADHDSQFGRQLLAHHVRVAPMTAQPLSEPVRVPCQQTGPGWDPARQPATGSQVALHRLAVAPDLGCDPACTPAQIVKPLHRCHLVRRPHRLSPPIPAWRKIVQSIHRFAYPCYAGWLGS